jgi:hypothetical protein
MSLEQVIGALESHWVRLEQQETTEEGEVEKT